MSVFFHRQTDWAPRVNNQYGFVPLVHGLMRECEVKFFVRIWNHVEHYGMCSVELRVTTYIIENNLTT